MGLPKFKSGMIKASNADNSATWVGEAIITTDVDVNIEGTGCGSAICKTTPKAFYTSASTAPVNLRDKYIAGWLYSIAGKTLDLKSAGGFQLYARDTAGNWGSWTVAGRDTYAGGWAFYMINCETPLSYSSSAAVQAASLSTASTFIGYRISSPTSKNAITAYWDAIFYGTPELTVYDGDTITTSASFEYLYSASQTDVNQVYGLFDKFNSVYFSKAKITIGTGSFNTYFSDRGKTVVWADVPVTQSLFQLNITSSGTTCSFGQSIGTGLNIVAASPMSFLSATGTLLPELTVDPSISRLDSYGTRFTTFGTMSIGNTTSPFLGSALSMVDNVFADTEHVIKNVNGDPSIMLRNSITFTSGNLGIPSILLYDTGSVDGGSLRLISNYGFTSTEANTTQSFRLTNQDFSSLYRYITVYNNKTWNVVNPVWSVTSSVQTQLYFKESGSNTVKEYYSFTGSVVTEAGSAITTASVFVYEGLLTSNIVNSASSNISGAVDFDISKNVYNASGSQLSVTSSGNYALKVYKYGKSPYVSSFTVASAQNPTITLIADVDITEPVRSTALSNGAGITLVRHGTGETDTIPARVIAFDSSSVTPASGSVIKGITSLASGSLIEVIGTTAGVYALDTRNAAAFINGEYLASGSTTCSRADISGSANSFYQPYTWVIDCNSKALTTVYDYLAAQSNQTPLSSSFQKMMIWGQSSLPQMLYLGVTGYYTLRNSTLQEGVWLAKRGAGTIAYMQSDSGSNYSPPASVTHTLTGVISGSEVVYIATGSTTEVFKTTVDATGISLYPYIYAGSDTTVNIYIASLSYEWLQIQNQVLSSANQIIPIQQRFDRNYNNPAGP